MYRLRMPGVVSSIYLFSHGDLFYGDIKILASVELSQCGVQSLSISRSICI